MFCLNTIWCTTNLGTRSFTSSKFERTQSYCNFIKMEIANRKYGICKLQSNLKLAEMHWSDSLLQIILDAKYFDSHTLGRKMKIQNFKLLSTQFEWSLIGFIPNSVPQAIITHASEQLLCFIAIWTIYQKLRKFWEVEECKPTSSNVRKRDACEEHFFHIYSRRFEGRFNVYLSIKLNFFLSAIDSYFLTKRELLSFERKMDPETHKLYVELWKSIVS